MKRNFVVETVMEYYDEVAEVALKKKKVAVAFLNGAPVINAHTDEETTITALIEFTSPTREFAQFIPGVEYQSLNAIRFNNDHLVISRQSIAGTFKGDLVDRNIQKYNETVLDSMKIKRIIFRDGNVITF